MIAGLLMVGLLCLFYETVLIGVLALAQRREAERRELEAVSIEGVGAKGMPLRPAGARTLEGLDSLMAGAGRGPADEGAQPELRARRLRASDAEREAAADVVSAAMAEGRLDLDEGVDRLDDVFRAHYRDELRGLVDDLPPAAPRPRTGRRHGEAGSGSRLGGRGLLLAVVVTAFAVQMLTGVWVMWPVAVAALAPFALWRRR